MPSNTQDPLPRNMFKKTQNLTYVGNDTSLSVMQPHGIFIQDVDYQASYPVVT